uniref:CSON007879 protein n=1 Tax=Culicoides sonorensis TaxID=179676 RepID=A0A336N6X6_CULSO
MQLFYSERETEEIYKMSENHVKVGRVCAALYDHVWHRAVITKDMDDALFVTVMYIDYGTVSVVQLEDLRLLIGEFGQLPKLTMRGRLALVRPREYEDHWSLDPNNNQTESFFDLVYNKTLNAKLFAFEEEEEIYHLILGEDEIDMAHRNSTINRLITSNGQCEFLIEEFELWPYLDELYPTFDLLESHSFPTYEEWLKTDSDIKSHYYEVKGAKYYSNEYVQRKIKNRTVYGYHSHHSLINDNVPNSFSSAFELPDESKFTNFFSKFDDN